MIFILFTGYYIYDGINSSRYHLLFANLNTDRLTQICSSVSYTTELYAGANRYEMQGKNWDDSPLSFDVEVISEYPIDNITAKKIKRWMFNSSSWKKLYEDRGARPTSDEIIDGRSKRTYIECVFSNPSEIRRSGNLFGWQCTCTLATPMAVQEPVEVSYSDFKDNIILDVDTDHTGYTYPHIKIETKNNSGKSDITIENISDSGRYMQIGSVSAGTVIYADCGIGSITDNANNSLYDRLANQQFLRLVPGRNELKISGDIKSLKLVWSNMRYIM